jgi:hypothetical protein
VKVAVGNGVFVWVGGGRVGSDCCTLGFCIFVAELSVLVGALVSVETTVEMGCPQEESKSAKAIKEIILFIPVHPFEKTTKHDGG